MKSTLESLFSVLKEKKSPLIELFNDGLTREQIDHLLQESQLDLELVPEFYDLYEWKNGVNIYDNKGLYFGFFTLAVFVPLEILIESYIYYALDNDYWEKKLFPVFSNLCGDFYLLDIEPKSPTFKKVYIFSPLTVFSGVITVYDSLPKLLETIICCYKEDVYKYSPDENFVIIEPYKKREIAKRINPDSDYWKLFGS